LRAYAQNNDVTLIDFAHAERLDPTLFKDIHHLGQHGKKVFTEMLVEALGSLPMP
jgi:hypothetical protein